LCLWCYEKQHGKTLRSFRDRLRLFSKDNVSIRSLSSRKPRLITCPNCQSESVRRARLSTNRHNKYFCRNCNETWDITEKRLKLKKTQKKLRKEILKKTTNEHISIEMTYKGIQRIVHPYIYNDTYFVAFCTYRDELRTFRIDRMKSVKLGDKFEYRRSLYKIAIEQIRNIGSFYRY